MIRKWVLFLFISAMSLNVRGNTCEQFYDEEMPESHSRGIKEIDNFLEIANRLRKKNIHPKTTHISELATMVNPHLDFVKAAIEKQTYEDKGERLHLLKTFMEEAGSKIASEKVTYHWWVTFNFRLSILLTPKNKRTSIRGGSPDLLVETLLKTDGWINENGFESALSHVRFRSHSITLEYVINQFPTRIIFPTVVGDIGISALNKLFTTGVHAFGLVGDRTMVDGREMYPDHFFGHDFVHLVNDLYYISQWNSQETEDALKAFHEIYTKDITLLSVRKRQLVEFVYFFITHEEGYPAAFLVESGPIKATDYLTKDIKRAIDYCMNPTWFKQLIPLWINKESETDVRHFILESADEFNILADQINNKRSGAFYLKEFNNPIQTHR